MDAGVPKVTIVDLMGRSKEVATQGGRLNLTLSPQMQYVLLPRTSIGALRIASAELKKRLDALQVRTAAELPAQIAEAARTAATDPAMMNRLYHLVKAAETAAAASVGPEARVDVGAVAKAARQAVERREGADGYLRQARLALDWTERLTQQAGRDQGMAKPALLAAQATQGLAAVEKPAYPGVVVNAFIGEPGEIQKIRATVPVPSDPSTSIDDKFRFQIDRKAGETFDLELTVCNYYRHKIVAA